MKCPACREMMFVVEYNRIELDLCPACQGVWFDADELRLLLDEAAPLDVAPATTDEAFRKCPTCRERMDKVNIGPGRRVLIDACPAGCGLFFDDKETAELTRDLEEGGWQLKPEIRDFLYEMFPE